MPANTGNRRVTRGMTAVTANGPVDTPVRNESTKRKSERLSAQKSKKAKGAEEISEEFHSVPGSPMQDDSSGDGGQTPTQSQQ